METRAPTTLLDRSDTRSSSIRDGQGQRRASRFVEQVVPEYTPATSMYEDGEEEEEEDDPDDSAVGEQGLWRMVLRALNGCLHATACVLLVTILGSFLHDSHGVWYDRMSPQAVVILLLTGVDLVLDLGSLVPLQKKWPGWAILLRLLIGVGYLVIFIVYMAMDHVFPPWFTCWGLDHSLVGPMVYLFLWLIGVWNILHITVHRRRLSRAVRSCIPSIFSLSRQRRRSEEDAGAGSSSRHRRMQGDRRRLPARGRAPRGAWLRTQDSSSSLSPGNNMERGTAGLGPVVAPLPRAAVRGAHSGENMELSVIREEVTIVHEDDKMTTSLKTMPSELKSEEAGDTGGEEELVAPVPPAPTLAASSAAEHAPLGEIKL